MISAVVAYGANQTGTMASAVRPRPCLRCRQQHTQYPCSTLRGGNPQVEQLRDCSVEVSVEASVEALAWVEALAEAGPVPV